MGKFEHAEHKVEEYLRELEAKERSKKRKRVFKILPIFILGAILSYQYFFPGKTLTEPRKKLLQVYRASDLDSGKVKEIFEIDNAEIVIVHPLFGKDTIQSASEYEDIVNFARQAEEDKIAVNNSISQADSIRVAAKGTLEVFVVDVAGERRVSEPLTFTIENYDPEVTYFLDFGNGISRKVQEIHTYTYPRHGHFVMQLIARQSGRGASIFTKKYEIKPQEVEVDTLVEEEAQVEA